MPDKRQFHVFVAGGAGYIGSVTTAALIAEGHKVTVLDNLSNGHRKAVHPDARFFQGNITDRDIVEQICDDSIDVVMHFSAFIEVGESVTDPSKYYDNNVIGSIKFFDILRNAGVDKIVFSSTAAVYGEPDIIPLTEDAGLHPVNPYGRTKLIIEQVLRDYDLAYGFKSVCLRYFNAGGAFEQYGEDHHPESHLIPIIINASLKDKPFFVYGNDYSTSDGSCVRDYIHVRDLADAHIKAASYLVEGGLTDAFNLGSGNGFTVFEVIRAVETITRGIIRHEITERRDGDSASLVASPQKAQQILGWSQEVQTLEGIIQSAWDWKQRNPNGYGD